MNRPELRRALSAVLGLALILEACATRDPTANIGAEEAVQIANRLLESRRRGGISPSRVDLISTPDNSCLVEEVKRALADRRYYLVIYEVPNVVFGSTICVFVDAKGGTVIESGEF